MKINRIILFILLFLTTGCALANRHSSIIYSRTKDIRLTGQITAMKGETMLSVTWKYAKQKSVGDNITPDEELQDCFRSEIVYDGITEKTIHFLIKNYICGTYAPVSTEPVTYTQELPSRISFHSTQLKILSADHSKLIFESIQ